jgi:putative phosphoribosyl transferase
MLGPMAELEDLFVDQPLYHDRRAAGRLLARALEPEASADALVVGLARGGVVVADEVARALALPLDALAVRKVKHPWAPEYAIGAVAPQGVVYVRGRDGLTGAQVARAVASASEEADELDRRLHADTPPAELERRPCLLVDDGLATGATMIAAVRWARSRGARRVVAAAPVGAPSTAELLRREADAVICPNATERFLAVGLWYSVFGQVGDEDVVRLLAEAREPATA